MNIFKALFGGKTEDTEESKKEKEAKNFEILKFDGVRAMRARQAEYAVKCFSHALDIKDDDETRDYLSQALMANNELMEAMNQLKILAGKVSGNAAIYIRMANVAYLMDDFAAMDEACTSALGIEADNIQAMYLKAVAYEGQERYEDAIAILTDILNMKEDDAAARLLRGNICLKHGDSEAALADAEKLNEDDADNEDVIILMAAAKHAMKQLDEAEELCSRAIELDPFSTAAFKERALVRRDKGDKDGEEQDLQVLMELNPQEGTPDDDPARTMQDKMKENQINPLGI